MYELMPRAEYELRRNIKMRNILMADYPSTFNTIRDKLNERIKYYTNQCERLS